ncbi:hypothetical protein BJX99DRAFT_58082 [Aspergillus californicus]
MILQPVSENAFLSETSSPSYFQIGQSSARCLKRWFALRSLAHQPQFEIEAPRDLGVIANLIRHASKASDAKIRADVNVYTLESNRNHIGKKLRIMGCCVNHRRNRMGLRYNLHLIILVGMDERALGKRGLSREYSA